MPHLQLYPQKLYPLSEKGESWWWDVVEYGCVGKG